MKNRILSLAAALVLAGGASIAQAQAAPTVALAEVPRLAALPSQLDGHWVIFDTGLWFSLTQRFKMENFRTQGDGTFEATLSWWSAYERCGVEDITIRGTVTPDGMRFDVPTKCYTAEAQLKQQNGKWVGYASFQGAERRDTFALSARGR